MANEKEDRSQTLELDSVVQFPLALYGYWAAEDPSKY
jgi:hypothetical protein